MMEKVERYGARQQVGCYKTLSFLLQVLKMLAADTVSNFEKFSE
jgi:hypothetical protein